MRRIGVLVVSVLTVAVVASPLLRSPDYDSYPISSYPMFARDRGSDLLLTTAVGVDADGAQRYLSPEILAGTSQPVQASVTIERAVRSGRAEALCSEIADRIDDSEIVAVEVASGVYDVVAWFDGNETPRDREVHASCEPAA